jgi:ParB family chromosome partitioning protein
MARAKSAAIGTQLDLALALLDEDAGQPRTSFDEAKLHSLAESMRHEGVKIPLQVVPVGDGRYRITYGARRKRAAEIAELKTIPCLVVAEQPRLETLMGQVLAA